MTGRQCGRAARKIGRVLVGPVRPGILTCGLSYYPGTSGIDAGHRSQNTLVLLLGAHQLTRDSSVAPTNFGSLAATASRVAAKQQSSGVGGLGNLNASDISGPME